MTAHSPAPGMVRYSIFTWWIWLEPLKQRKERKGNTQILSLFSTLYLLYLCYFCLKVYQMDTISLPWAKLCIFLVVVKMTSRQLMQKSTGWLKGVSCPSKGTASALAWSCQLRVAAFRMGVLSQCEHSGLVSPSYCFTQGKKFRGSEHPVRIFFHHIRGTGW